MVGEGKRGSYKVGGQVNYSNVMVVVVVVVVAVVGRGAVVVSG